MVYRLADRSVDYLDRTMDIDSVDWSVVYWEWKRAFQTVAQLERRLADRLVK
jgi:hypothetical protein